MLQAQSICSPRNPVSRKRRQHSRWNIQPRNKSSATSGTTFGDRTLLLQLKPHSSILSRLARILAGATVTCTTYCNARPTAQEKLCNKLSARWRGKHITPTGSFIMSSHVCVYSALARCAMVFCEATQIRDDAFRSQRDSFSENGRIWEEHPIKRLTLKVRKSISLQSSYGFVNVYNIYNKLKLFVPTTLTFLRYLRFGYIRKVLIVWCMLRAIVRVVDRHCQWNGQWQSYLFVPARLL